jgi:Mrp family chromosome partitioning ATPase
VAVDSRPLPPEACASRRLSELLEESRDRYSAILIVGPEAERTVDVEMLAARTDAVLFVARNPLANSPAAARTVAGLAALRAPVLGAIVV